MNPPLLSVEDLSVSFAGPGGERRWALRGLGLRVYPAQTLALVGESGGGKSMAALGVLGLLPQGARVDSGRINFRSPGGTRDLLTLPERALRRVRGAEIAMIFQEPMTSLNPVYSIGEQIIEAVRLHQRCDATTAARRAAEALGEVGITDAPSRLRAYPHEFSGGMRQRVMIAMALACRPSLLLADEPTTALDVTIQAQILDLLGSLRRSRGLAMLLITHALGVVAQQADVVCVLYAGRVVEYARVLDLFDRPLHPYTRALLASIPRLHAPAERLTTVAQIMDDEGQFQRLPGAERGLRPWWPRHRPPTLAADADHAAGQLAARAMLAALPPDGHTLREVEPGHWVALWDTPAAREILLSTPDLPDTRPIDRSPRG
jgi:ABC-type dipeptide/oligopeptide/nickel transport system ATPase component